MVRGCAGSPSENIFSPTRSSSAQVGFFKKNGGKRMDKFTCLQLRLQLRRSAPCQACNIPTSVFVRILTSSTKATRAHELRQTQKGGGSRHEMARTPFEVRPYRARYDSVPLDASHRRQASSASGHTGLGVESHRTGDNSAPRSALAGSAARPECVSELLRTRGQKRG